MRRPVVHPLIWILLLGAVVRIGLGYGWSGWSPLFNDDAKDYHGLAQRLAATGAYTNDNGTPFSLRPPLYPAILAGLYQFFGLENDDAVRAIQAGIGLLTAAIVYRLAVLAYCRQVGLWAAAMCCFYPSLLGYANLLLSEAFFTFFAIAYTWLILEAVHRQSLSILAVAGAAMGLAALTRSVVLPFLPLLALFLLLAWQGSWTRRASAAFIPVAVFALIIAPWAVRNTRIQNTLTLIDVMGGRNAMMGNYEYTPLERSWATISDVPGEQAWYRVLRQDYADQGPVTQGQLDKLALRHAARFVIAHPWLTLKRDAVKFFNFWQLEREFLAAASDGYFGRLTMMGQLLLAVVICGSYAAVLFGAVFGICCMPPADPRTHWFLILSILFPCAIHTLIFAHSRYHLPIVPLLAVYAAATIVRRNDIWQQRRSIVFGTASVTCFVLVLGWLRELVFVDFEAVRRVLS